MDLLSRDLSEGLTSTISALGRHLELRIQGRQLSEELAGAFENEAFPSARRSR